MLADRVKMHMGFSFLNQCEILSKPLTLEKLNMKEEFDHHAPDPEVESESASEEEEEYEEESEIVEEEESEAGTGELYVEEAEVSD